MHGILDRYNNFFTHPLHTDLYSRRILLIIPHPLSSLSARYNSKSVGIRGRSSYIFVHGVVKVFAILMTAERELVPIMVWKDQSKDTIQNVDSRNKEEVVNVRWVFMGRIRFMRKVIEFEGVDRFTISDGSVQVHEIEDVSRMREWVGERVGELSLDARLAMQARIHFLHLRFK